MGDSFFKSKWKRYFVVLSNVGLLFFNDPQDAYPKKIFPLNGGFVYAVDPAEVDGSLKVFKVECDAQTEVTLKCASLSDFN